METAHVTFQSQDWKYIKKECEETLVKCRSLLENPNTTYKEKLIAIGQIIDAKKILNLPSVVAPHYKG